MIHLTPSLYCDGQEEEIKGHALLGYVAMFGMDMCDGLSSFVRYISINRESLTLLKDEAPEEYKKVMAYGEKRRRVLAGECRLLLVSCLDECSTAEQLDKVFFDNRAAFSLLENEAPKEYDKVIAHGKERRRLLL